MSKEVVNGFLQVREASVVVFRRMGVRTRREINREKYALKALRGDFDSGESGASAE